MPLTHRPLRLSILATTDHTHTAFGPYVPAIDDRGRVAFQASLADGHSAVRVHDGTRCETWADTRAAGMPASAFISHADLNASGRLCVYADLRDGGQGVLVLDAPDQAQVWGRAPQLTGIGPLGPTMNPQGLVTVRGRSPDGAACVAWLRDGQTQVLAAQDDRHRGFEGLPVVNGLGQVAFHAVLADGRQAALVQTTAGLITAAITGEGIAEIRPFVVLDDRGQVGLAGTDEDGRPALCLGMPGACHRLPAPDAEFESYRGLLVDGHGPVVFYGTPQGRELGIHTGPHPSRHRLLGLGDAWQDGTISGFALNPVSVNAHGQIALRVAVEDGREFIVRGDPA